MPFRDPEKKKEYYRRYMRKRRASSVSKDVKPRTKPEVAKEDIKMRKQPFDLNAPAIETLRVLDPPGLERVSKLTSLKNLTTLEAIRRIMEDFFSEVVYAADTCKDYPCRDLEEDPFACRSCLRVKLEVDVERLEEKVNDLNQRMKNASYLVRHAFGNRKIDVHCPLCGERVYLEFDKAQKVWVCSNCRKVPF